MIRTCDNCGGLYGIEDMEMFAGTPCFCGARRTQSDASPEVRSIDWLDVLRENVAREESDLQKAYNEVLTKRILGDAPNEVTGFERALETALMPMARMRIAIERTLKSTSNARDMPRR